MEDLVKPLIGPPGVAKSFCKSIRMRGILRKELHQLWTDDFPEVVARNATREPDATAKPLLVHHSFCRIKSNPFQFPCTVNNKNHVTFG